MQVLHEQPTQEDILSAIAGDYCPFCGGDAVRAKVGVRARCRSCLGRWEQHEYHIVQVPHPDISAPQPEMTPVYIPTPADKRRAIDVIEAEVEAYMKTVNSSPSSAR